MSDDPLPYSDYYDDEERHIRHQRSGKKRPPKRKAEELSTLAETTGIEAGFMPTYQPARFEATWLLGSLRSFYEDHLISDILAHVRGGKEASVYCCAADPSTGEELLAAKVYRPRQFRNLRNDKLYRDGRTILTAEGRPVNKSDQRLMRAIGKKTAVGQQITHTSWLMHEYTTLAKLNELGAAVPRPFAVNDNSLLMSYIGDERTAAPTLNGVRLMSNEARPLFDEVIRNITLMLSAGIIHGDLSAYNILYWQGKVTIIDFPQIMSINSNRYARDVFQRDVVRICEYFQRQGVGSNPEQLADELWERHLPLDPDSLDAQWLSDL